MKFIFSTLFIALSIFTIGQTDWCGTDHYYQKSLAENPDLQQQIDEYMALHLVCSLEFSSAVMFVPEVVTRSRATPTCDTDPDNKGHQELFDVIDH